MASIENSLSARLADLGEFRNGVNFGKGMKGSGLGLINVKDIFCDSPKVDFESLDLVNLADSRGVERYFVEAGDLFFVRSSVKRDGIGFVAYSDRKNHDAVHCGFVIRFRPDKHKVDSRFLTYALRSPNTRERIRNLSGGAAITNISQEALRTLELDIPPLPEQRRIAGILSAYDELMENSQRRIRLLEAMARALYRECIREDGDSTSVKGILETDYWTFISANVSPYGGTKRYYATADIEGLAVQGAGIDYTFAEKPSRAQKQPTPFSLWFARMKDTYKIAWYSEVNAQSADSTILSSGFAGFQAVEPLYFPLLFLTVSSKEFHAQKDLYCTGATQMSLTNEGLSIIEVPAPTKRAARRLGERTLPLLNQILVLQLRIQNLRRTRDLLLPRLLSGQVSLAVNGT